MFEMFNRKPKSPQEKDQEKRNTVIAAAGLAAVGAAATHQEIPDLSNLNAVNAPVTVEAPANNPTLGKHAGDAPETIVIPAPTAEAADPVVINLAEEQVVVTPADHEQFIVEQPEH